MNTLLQGWVGVCCLLAFGLQSVLAQAQKAPPSTELERRTGHGPAPRGVRQFMLPTGVSLADGLSEDDAVAIALWNNAQLHADLAVLGLARADLLEAGLLRNPILQIVLPIGPYRQFESLLNFPFEVFWQRRKRVAAANEELQRIAVSLEQNVLNLMRDVRLAYTDWLLAQARVRLATEAVEVRTQTVRLTNVRLRAGDVSEIEATAARLDESLAAEQAGRMQREVKAARDRLRLLIGMNEPQELAPAEASGQPSSANFVTVANAAALSSQAASLDELLKAAFDARPDLRAAELAIESATKRAQWEHSRIVTLAGLLNIKQGDGLGFSPRPGVLAELPIFNRNQGGIARADAEVARAAWQFLATRQRIASEVQEAFNQLAQARETLTSWRAQTMPLAEENMRLAERAFNKGDQSFLFVLDATRRVVEVRQREVELLADAQRARAQLDRSLGRKSDAKP
jgi:outer membrane protein, heavy metal efflux system